MTAQTAELGRLSPVTDNVHAFTQPDWGWGLNNCGVVSTDEGVLLVDTCFTERRTTRLREEIARVGGAPVRYVVNTHHHGDHTFGNYQFPDAAVIGHPYCRDKIISEGLAVVPYFGTVEWGDIRISPPTVLCADRLTLELGGLTAEIIPVAPAHTLGDVVVWLPERRVLFVGDIIFNGCTPVITDGSLSGMRSALRTLRALRPEVVVPGHGPLAGPEVFDAAEDYFDFVADAARSGRERGLNPLDAARAVDLGPYAAWQDSERLVANIARTYSEMAGEPIGTPLRRAEIAPMMTAFAGRPLRCLA
ncbi:MBL fold metallo-hydrolase [Streptomyces alanosinicus]|uniref:MBL fold metallo-hydrolase n=1 Tax=Streptomyces alanosinicus TaxID=68171 RepID=A0A918YRV8_9ACTN|nr:MBL fold metallo-hydrolase [Streptomyces alanosinicus]GHE13591.1 MBL fold metallo-hydrolase [Streptomyces alanosinicus]